MTSPKISSCFLIHLMYFIFRGLTKNGDLNRMNSSHGDDLENERRKRERERKREEARLRREEKRQLLKEKKLLGEIAAKKQGKLNLFIYLFDCFMPWSRIFSLVWWGLVLWCKKTFQSALQRFL